MKVAAFLRLPRQLRMLALVVHLHRLQVWSRLLAERALKLCVTNSAPLAILQSSLATAFVLGRFRNLGLHRRELVPTHALQKPLDAP